MHQELQTLLADHQLYHSDFQMDHFITGQSGGTVYGMYKQALRELFKRYRGLKQLEIERRLLLLDVQELEGVHNVYEHGTFELQRTKIRLVQKRMALEDLERNIKDTEREFGRFFGQAKQLKEEVGELTPQRRVKLDEEMWVHKVKSMAALDFITWGRLRENTVLMLHSMPARLRRPLVQSFTVDPQKTIDWFEEYEPAVPLVAVEAESIQRLLETK